jgi:hypothetical protein
MKIQLSLFSVAFAVISYGQTVIVNPDGTHSTMISTPGAATGIVVNPNGTHSTVVNTSPNSSVIVNPNGTHSTVIKNGNISTIVNPNGTHSIAIDNGSTLQVVTPELKNPAKEESNSRQHENLDKPAKSTEDNWFSEPPAKVKKVRKRDRNKVE